jgi:hypothetical protein
MNIETKGGVSPLKKRRTGGVSGKKTTRGGTEAGVATSKKGNWLGGRGGYAKSRGIEGGGGQNVGGYNIHTRFVPRKSSTAPKVGSGTSKPYSYDKDGNLVVNTGYEYKQDPDVTTTTKTGRESGGSFEDVWKANKDNFQDKWKDQAKDDDGGYAAWVKQAQKEIDEGFYEKKTTEDGQKWRRSWKEKDGKKVYTSDWETI